MKRDRRSRIVLVVLIVSSLAGGSVWGSFIFRNTDIHEQPWALQIARNLVLHGVYGLGPAGDRPKPTAFAEPAYPFWLAFLLKADGPALEHLAVYQSLWHAGAALVTVALAREVLPLPAALLAGFLTALDPLMLSGTGRLWKENLSILVFGLLAWMLLRLYPYPRGSHWAVVGLGCGFTSLFLFQAGGMTLFILAWMVFSVRRDRPRRWASRVALFSVFWMAAVSPWIYRNWRSLGTPEIAPTRLHWTLCEKAALLSTGLPYSEILPYALSLYSIPLSGKLFPEYDARKDLKSPDWCRTLRKEILAGGGSEKDVESGMKRAALDLISRQPVQYLLSVALSPISFLIFEVESMGGLRPIVERRAGSPAWAILNGMLRLYTAVVLISAAAGGVEFFRKRNPKGGFLSLYVIFYLAGHAITRIHSYFVITILPLILVLAVAGIRGRISTAAKRPGAPAAQP